MGLGMALTWLTLDADTFYSLGVVMILVGIMVFVAAFALLLISSVKGSRVRGGGALIIGPLPIVFGTDKESIKAVLLLSIILTIIAFTLFVVLHLLWR